MFPKKNHQTYDHNSMHAGFNQASCSSQRFHSELLRRDYGLRMHEEGVKIVAIPKTMDNDVAGTDYCIGFSTCVTRTIELTHRLRTTAGSHERALRADITRQSGQVVFTLNAERRRSLLVGHQHTIPRRPAVVKAQLGSITRTEADLVSIAQYANHAAGPARHA